MALFQGLFVINALVNPLALKSGKYRKRKKISLSKFPEPNSSQRKKSLVAFK